MDDYIDFPCSADWLDHYNRVGLTPRSSGRLSPVLQRLEQIEKQQLELYKLIRRMLDNRTSKPKHEQQRKSTNKSLKHLEEKT